MKKNQNPPQKPALALQTFNRSIKLMAVAMIGMFAGVVNSQAETRAVVGRPVRPAPGGGSPGVAQYVLSGGATNNGLIAKGYWGEGSVYYIDLNELAVNRAMSAAPIGTLKVTPSNNASEQTKVQWSVE
jgi:hypothetical protein